MTNKNKIINQAQKFIQKGQWDKAIKELQKLVAEDPSDVRTLLKLGDVYAKKGDRDQATKVYKQVAASYGEQGFFLKAVAVYKQILKHDPKHLEVTLKLAELYEHLGLTSEAMVQYQIAAQMHDETGNVRETLDVLKRMVELDGDNVASRIKLAESFSRENRVQEAIEQFLRAAEILKRHNRIEDYIKVTERLVYHDPNRLDVVKELAKLYLERNDTKRALAKLQLCFKAAPRDIETLTLLSGAFRELGQVQKTVFVLRELARIHQENGEVTEARSVAQKILEIDPNDADARAALGYPTAPGSRAGNFAGALNGAQVFGSTGVMPGFGGATGMQPAVFGQAPAPYPGPAMNSAQSFGVTTGGMAAHPAPAGFGSTTGPQAAYGAAGGFGAGTGPQPAQGTHAFAGGGHVAGYPPGPAAGYQPPQMGAPGFGPGSGPMPAAQAYGGAPAAAYGSANPTGFGVATNLGVAIPAPNATPRRRGIQDPSEPAEPRVPSKSTSSGAAKAESPQVAKILTETDVYIKYGLRDKAVEHLRKVFEIDADSVAAYGKLRDIYSGAGDFPRAAEMVGNIMQIHARRGDQEALAAARAELAGLAPNHPLLSGVPVAGDMAGAVPDAEGLDSIDITEASDNYDARDLRAAAAQRGVTLEQLEEQSPAEADAVDAWLQQDPGFDELAEGEAQEAAATFAGDEAGGDLDPEVSPESEVGSAEVAYAFDHEISSVSVAPDDIVESVESEQEVEGYAEEVRGTGPFEQPSAEAGFPSEDHDADVYGEPGLDPFASSHQTAAPEPHADLEMPNSPRTATEAHRDLESPDAYSDLGLPTEEEANELPEAASGIVMLEATSFGDDALAGSAEQAEPGFEAAEETAGEVWAAPGDAADGLDGVPWYEAADPEEASLGATPLEFQSPVVEAPRPEGAFSPEEKQKIEDELDEAEFLAGEGLREEALEAIASVLSRVTGHPRAVALRALIESGALGGEADEEQESDEANPADDGAPGLAAGDAGQPPEAESFGDVSDDELADAFDLGGDGGDGTNPEDHYDEAMAYKELNRLDDAIAHFRLAANSPSRAIPALEMIGHCLVAKGEYEEAIQSFYAAFERGVEGPAAINLKFEIAATYEAAGDAEQAVSWFRSCYSDDPDHRDVRGRLAALGVDPSEAETPSPHMNGVSAQSEQPEQQGRAVSKKNKISYL